MNDISRDHNPRAEMREKKGKGEGVRHRGPVRTYGAIDLGTNNCRLLIARPKGEGFDVIGGFSRIVRLGEGLTQTGRLSEAAMARTIEALKVCRDKMREKGVRRVRAVATQACRTAENADDFVARVREETGLQMDIVSPEEEARLAVRGCDNLLERDKANVLVFDIGGGSTEIIHAGIPEKGGAEIGDMLSLSCGVITLAEEYGGKTVTEDSYERMIADVTRRIADFAGLLDLDRAIDEHDVQMLGMSGTMTTIAAVHLALPYYQRRKVDGRILDRHAVRTVAERLREMSYTERTDQPCIGPDRADLVLPGCAILEGIMRTWPCERLHVADRGLREGLLLNMMRRDARRDYFRKKARQRNNGA